MSPEFHVSCTYPTNYRIDLSTKGFGKRPDDALNTSSWISSSVESICGLVMVNNLQEKLDGSMKSNDLWSFLMT